MKKFKVKKYKQYYLNEVMTLHHDTIHEVCKDDYSQLQIEAWAPDKPDIGVWLSSFHGHSAFVVFHKDKIVGFCDMTETGFVNRLYTHKDYQRQGVATLLMKEMEKYAKKHKVKELTLESSKTGRPFYEKYGFSLIKTQNKTFRGVVFENFLMKKVLG